MDVPALGNMFEGQISALYTLAVLGSVGMGIISGLMAHLSIAMMLLPYFWSLGEQGVVLSSYFWGYFVTQIPGLARITGYFSPNWVTLFGVIINIICTLLTPVMAEHHYYLLVILRVLQGIGGGMAWTAMRNLLAIWAPPADRSKMTAMLHGGASLGIVTAVLISGLLSRYAGWHITFYVMGCLPLIWCIMWVLLVQDTTLQQPFITVEEITEQAEHTDNDHKLQVPWRAVLSSRPFLAILVAHVCCKWGWYMLFIELPYLLALSFMSDAIQLTLIMALPFLANWLFGIGLSLTLNWMQNKNLVSPTQAKEIGTSFATAVPAICLFVFCFTIKYYDCRAVSIAMITLATVSAGGQFCEFHSIYVDIAPKYADELMAVTNSIAVVPGIIVPLIFGAMTTKVFDFEGLWTILGIAIGMYIIAFISLSFYGTTEEQPWNRENENFVDRKTNEHVSSGQTYSVRN